MEEQSAQSWEYLTSADDADLAALGRQGWELIAVTPTGPEGALVLYFKRPALDFRDRVTLEQKRRYYALLGRAPDDEH